MNEHDEAALESYPHGRGYGHDYMRGGEVLGGYGYAERDEYAMARGDLIEGGLQSSAANDGNDGQSQTDIRT